VNDNILGDLTHKFPFGPKEHKIGLEMTPVKMAKKRYKHTFRATPFHGANEKYNFLARVCIHCCQFTMSRQSLSIHFSSLVCSLVIGKFSTSL
jgi:hypothetical protein